MAGKSKENVVKLNEEQLMWQTEILDNVEIVLDDPVMMRFCDVYLKTFSLVEAYAQSHPENKSSRKTMREAACRYFKKNPILGQYIWQQEKKAGKGIKTRTETLQKGSELMDSPNPKISLGATKMMMEHYDRTDGKGNEHIVKLVYVTPPKGKKKKKFDERIESFINE